MSSKSKATRRAGFSPVKDTRLSQLPRDRRETTRHGDPSLALSLSIALSSSINIDLSFRNWLQNENSRGYSERIVCRGGVLLSSSTDRRSFATRAGNRTRTFARATNRRESIIRDRYAPTLFFSNINDNDSRRSFCGLPDSLVLVPISSLSLSLSSSCRGAIGKRSDLRLDLRVIFFSQFLVSDKQAL